MSRINSIEAGTQFGTVSVVGLAPSRGGHAYWDALCRECGVSAAVRGSLLRSGTYRCRCQVVASPKTVKARVTLATLAAQIESLTALVVALGKRPAAAPTPAKLSVASVGGGGMNQQTRIDNFAASVDKASSLAQAKDEATKEEFLDRLRVEGEALMLDADEERREARTERQQALLASWR